MSDEKQEAYQRGYDAAKEQANDILDGLEAFCIMQQDDCDMSRRATWGEKAEAVADAKKAIAAMVKS